MSVLITGAAGLIGAHVTRILSGRGDGGVVAFDLSPSAGRLDDLGNGVRLAHGDLGDFPQVLDIVERSRPSDCAILQHAFGGV